MRLGRTHWWRKCRRRHSSHGEFLAERKPVVRAIGNISFERPFVRFGEDFKAHLAGRSDAEGVCSVFFRPSAVLMLIFAPSSSTQNA